MAGWFRFFPPRYASDLTRTDGAARSFFRHPQGGIIAIVTGLSVSVEDTEGGPTVMRLAGEADVTTGALAEALSAEASKKPRLLLVDLSALTFIDSAALHQLVRAYRKVGADGGRLALIGANGAVARVLQLSALDQVLPTYASAEEADGQ